MSQKKENRIKRGGKKIVENKFNSSCEDPRIYKNSILPAYLPEKKHVLILLMFYVLIINKDSAEININSSTLYSYIESISN